MPDPDLGRPPPVGVAEALERGAASGCLPCFALQQAPHSCMRERVLQFSTQAVWMLCAYGGKVRQPRSRCGTGVAASACLIQSGMTAAAFAFARRSLAKERI